MFRLVSYESKDLQLNTNLIKMKHLVSKALAEIRYVTDQGNAIHSQKKISETSSEAESIDEVLNRLEKGYLVMKHSKNTKQPHPKLVYLSKDLKHLCWRTPGQGNQKSIPLFSISRIVKEDSPLYMQNASQVRDLSCCLAIISTARSLELQTKTEDQAELLKQQLCRAVRLRGSLCQNYKYSFI